MAVETKITVRGRVAARRDKSRSSAALTRNTVIRASRSHIRRGCSSLWSPSQQCLAVTRERERERERRYIYIYIYIYIYRERERERGGSQISMFARVRLHVRQSHLLHDTCVNGVFCVVTTALYYWKVLCITTFAMFLFNAISKSARYRTCRILVNK